MRGWLFGTVALLTFGILLASKALRWKLLNHCAELDRIEDEGLRDTIRYHLLNEYEPSRLKAILLAVTPTLLFDVLGDALISAGRGFYGLAMILVLLPLIAVGEVWLVRNELKRAVRRALAFRGVLVCLHCGYDLSRQEESRCPECGHAFDPARRSLKKGAFYAVGFWQEPKVPGNERP